MRATLSRSTGLEPLKGEAGDFARIFQVQLVFDVRAMCFHRFGTEMQQLRDLAHFVAFADQFQDFKFAIAQSCSTASASPSA